jgi:UPF0755 protein
MRRWTLRIAAAAGLLGTGILLYGFVYALAPIGGDVPSKTFRLDRGLTFREVADLLEREGIIPDVTRFVLLGRIVNASHRVKAGEYDFDFPISPWEILQKILQGRVKTYKITIPEGYTLLQIADLLDAVGIVTQGAFLDRASSPETLARYHIDGENLEGYLFPDTYAWAKETEPDVVIRFIIQRFRQVFTAEMAEQAARMGLSEREIMTIASIIEKETSDPSERPLVSAVIHNRLKKRIPLQSDPTVIYGLPNFNGNLTRADLKRETPYNTYLLPGLPPGPICNPGSSSIAAALSPASVEYLYFVSKNDGTHHFSSTLEEHERAVDRYQRRRKR